MPILIPPQLDAPLEQGDLLEGVHFAVAGEGSATLEGPCFALVLSRNCNALRDAEIVVAKVQHKSFQDFKVATLEECRRVLSRIRDGRDAPDQFYLGELPGSKKRYVARLDSLHTIKLPADRQAYIAKHRKFRLDPAFLSDLHARIFAAFAPLGFDDHAWLSDDDLRLVIGTGVAELAGLRSELSAAEHELDQLLVQEQSEKRLDPCRAKVDNLRKSVAKAELALLPYEAESQKRKHVSPK
ncbi:MAG: hypothetical protein U0183_17365 [Polyangiaceae bacterium]